MRIYHINDSYMFNEKNKKGTHRYAIYTDRKTKELRAIPLTHLYEIAPNKLKRIKNGHIKEYKLACYKMPSGVSTSYITKDINGKPLSLNKSNSRASYSLSKKDSSSLKRIAKIIFSFHCLLYFS